MTGIKKFIERYNKMPKFLAFICLAFFFVVKILQKAKAKQEADMVRKVKEITAELKRINAELRASIG